MTVNAQSYLHAAYPLCTRSRRFHLRWNSSKTPGRNPRKGEWQECEGVLFPPGSVIAVALSNGQTFPQMDDLESVLKAGGDYELEYIDE